MEKHSGVGVEVSEGYKKVRNFPSLDLSATSTLTENTNQPILVIQSPKTPTLSRKLKAVSLDSEPIPKPASTLEVSRDVFSMPNTPKRQLKSYSKYDNEKSFQTASLTSDFNSSSNLKSFPSNSSISSSQILKTLPEIMTLQDFSDNRPEPVRIKAKGLLERRGSNASLTIDLGSSSKMLDPKVQPLRNFNNIKSVSHLNLSTIGTEKCSCSLKICDGPTNKKIGAAGATTSRISGKGPKSQSHLEVNCKNSVQDNKVNICKNRCYTFHRKCNCLCNFKCRRKSLSNENLYIPPCSFCQSKVSGRGSATVRHCKGCKRTVYPRQAGLCQSQVLSEDFKLHLQNIQYLQTAGSVLSINDLKAICEPSRVPKLHQEFWEVPLNLQEKCIVSGSQNKNRYKGVLPNEHSRVHLPREQDYIHANYIKGPDYTESAYIATQGPMAHTCEDFWQMVWINKCNCIVMLTGLIEKGRSKCELYFPLGKSSQNVEEKSFYYVTTTKVQDRFTFDFKNIVKYEEETIAFEELDEVVYGNFKIRFMSRSDLEHYSVRLLELCYLDEINRDTIESRKIHHYWYSKWQDHKMTSPEEVLQLALDVLKVTGKIENEAKTVPKNDTSTVNQADINNAEMGKPHDQESNKLSDNNSFKYEKEIDKHFNEIKNSIKLYRNELNGSDSNHGFVKLPLSDIQARNHQESSFVKDCVKDLQGDRTLPENEKSKQPLNETKKISRTLRSSNWHKEFFKLQDEIKQNLLKKSQSALDYFTSSKENVNGDMKLDLGSKKNILKSKSLSHGDSFIVETSSNKNNLHISVELSKRETKEVKVNIAPFKISKVTTTLQDSSLKSSSLLDQQTAAKFRENSTLNGDSLENLASTVFTRESANIKVLATTNSNISEDQSTSKRTTETVSKSFSSRSQISDRDSSSEEVLSDSLSLEYDLSSSLLPKKSLELTFSPIVVHCSAGIGRTGCFLAILNGIQQLKGNRNVDVLAILCSLRLNRGGMVQTAEQYELIHRVLKLYADSL